MNKNSHSAMHSSNLSSNKNDSTDLSKNLNIYRQIDHLIHDKLMPAIHKILTSGELAEIFDEFLTHCKSTSQCITDEQSRNLYTKAFAPWLLFHWREYKDNKSIAQIIMEYDVNSRDSESNSDLVTKPNSIAQSLMLTTEQKALISELCNNCYSFYRIISENHKNKSITLEDMLLEKEVTIKCGRFHHAHILLISGIVLAKIIPFTEYNIMVGAMPVVISNYESINVLKLKHRLKKMIKNKETLKSKVDDNIDINNNTYINDGATNKNNVSDGNYNSNSENNRSNNIFLTTNLLRDEYDFFLRQCYFTLAFNRSHSLSNLIELKNYEFDELCYCDVNFDLHVHKDEIVETMTTLTQLSLSDEALHKYHNGPIFDRLTLDSSLSKLTIGLDSKENINSTKDIIKQRLFKEKVSFSDINIYSIKFGTDELKDRVNNIIYLSESKLLPKGEINYSDDYLFAIRHKLSRLKNKFIQMLTWNLQYWPDIKLSALGNKSPREAIKTAEGAELVEEILQYFEEYSQYGLFCSIGDDKYRLLFRSGKIDVSELRRQLTLALA